MKTIEKETIKYLANVLVSCGNKDFSIVNSRNSYGKRIYAVEFYHNFNEFDFDKARKRIRRYAGLDFYYCSYLDNFECTHYIHYTKLKDFMSHNWRDVFWTTSIHLVKEKRNIITKMRELPF